MKKIFLTSGLVLCMACPAFAEPLTGTTPIDDEATSANCVAGTLGTSADGATTNFVARWTADEYTINYVKGADGLLGGKTVANVTGNAPIATTGITFESTNVSLATNTYAVTGYHFNGWKSSIILANGNTGPITYKGSQSSTPNGDFGGGLLATYGYDAPNHTVDVEATWAPNTYTVSYNATTHSATPSAGTSNTATYDTVYAEPNDIANVKAAANGYTFLGWTTDSTPVVNKTGATTGTIGGSGEWTVPSTWTTDAGATVYAAYVANTYNITFDCGSATTVGGTDMTDSITGSATSLNTTADQDGAYAALSGTPGTCALVGWTFAGWDCTNDLNTAGGTYTFAADTACSATWTQNSIGLTFTAPDATTAYTSSGNSGSCAYDDGFTLPTNEPSKTGYTFDGWEVSSVTPAPQGN